MASGKLHYTASGWGGMVMNRDDSYFNLHPTTTRGFLETVNWNLKQAEYIRIFTIYYS